MNVLGPILRVFISFGSDGISCPEKLPWEAKLVKAPTSLVSISRPDWSLSDKSELIEPSLLCKSPICTVSESAVPESQIALATPRDSRVPTRNHTELECTSE